MAGRAVSGIGDFNGDGIPDVLIGAPGASPGQRIRAGISYIVFGRTGVSTSEVILGDLNGSEGISIPGLNEHDYAGLSVGSAGDINGDGLADIMIAATGADPNGLANAGTVYVVFGTNSADVKSVDLRTLDGVNGFAIHGSSNSDRMGSSVDVVGDFNGDGLDDIVVGAGLADFVGRQNAGASYLIFGSAESFEPHLGASTIEAGTGVTLIGASANDASGSVVAGAGDVNGDGFDDLLIGSPGFDQPSTVDEGSVFVVFGNDSSDPVLDLSSIAGNNGFVITGFDVLGPPGRSAGAAGDINADGYSDIILGQRDARIGEKFRAGSARLVYGRPGNFPTIVSSENLHVAGGFTIEGAVAAGRLGHAVGPAGDMNSDGYDDVALSAYRADSGAGITYVLYGRARAFSGTLPAAYLDGNTGLSIRSPKPYSGSGYSFDSVGDINGDGSDDLLIGLPFLNDDRGGAQIFLGTGSIFLDGFEG
ncbi:MAG: integrin alpha [Lysobacterales bacterium]